MPEKCKYENLYFDFDSREFITYKCEEDAVKDGLCIFHHKTYWKEHKDEVRKKFVEKVKNAIENKKPLLCIGYNLPEVSFSMVKFEIPVYFKDAVFHEKVIFILSNLIEERTSLKLDFYLKQTFLELNFHY
jgi:uncharacterized protein YdaL